MCDNARNKSPDIRGRSEVENLHLCARSGGPSEDLPTWLDKAVSREGEHWEHVLPPWFREKLIGPHNVV